MINLGRNHLGSWDDVQYVLAVAKTGSFIVAAEKLGTNQSTVSRHVQRLERRLGVKLFDRYSHGMRLTPSGAGLIEKARNMEAAANEIERQELHHVAGLRERAAQPAGGELIASERPEIRGERPVRRPALLSPAQMGAPHRPQPIH